MEFNLSKPANQGTDAYLRFNSNRNITYFIGNFFLESFAHKKALV